MSDFAIRAEGLGKRYHIGAAGRAPYRTLRETLVDTARAPFRRASTRLHPNGRASVAADTTFWALKDVSFEVQPGEVVGIIGRNGAGKSTLLKILARITKPTEGQARIRGRIGSLLEVGTGFHHELTGRENVFLSGAIIGMKRAEIARKFDEIVAFAEVEKFIDTPVKHYSSGMFVRLAFAVAAHLEPEILLVDEVLAVGDIDFQKKCIGSMQSVARAGRTVLVISHNMGLIESLCQKSMWLENGRIAREGETSQVISDYATSFERVGPPDLFTRKTNSDNTNRFLGVDLISEPDHLIHEIAMGKGLIVRVELLAASPIRHPWLGIQIRDEYDHLVAHIANREAGFELAPLIGHCTVTCMIEKLNIIPGRYFINLVMADMSNRLYDEVFRATYFDVLPSDVLGTGMPLRKGYGVVYFPTDWKVETASQTFLSGESK